MEPLPASPPADERFLERYEAVLGTAAPVSFAAFMEFALYDPEVGYYCAPRERVGRAEGTDFVTAASMDAVFGTLIAEAAAALVPGSAAGHVFVEIGAEPGRPVLAGVDHPFADAVTIRRGDPLEIPPQAVVFSNELFDAQPFHRVRRKTGKWREIGVGCDGRGGLEFVDLAEVSEAVASIATRLPANAPDGYTIDLPIAAADLMRAIGGQAWSGAILAFDYGRAWEYLCHGAPEGTARAYLRHSQSNDLLANPGQQDLTCHVCWDWLEDALREQGFEAISRMSQEAFLLHRAGAAVNRLVREHPDPLSRPRTQLKSLLHPGMFGQKFEVLSAIRPPGPPARPGDPSVRKTACHAETPNINSRPF